MSRGKESESERTNKQRVERNHFSKYKELPRKSMGSALVRQWACSNGALKLFIEGIQSPIDGIRHSLA
jgi:hypothetical protein